MLSDIYWFHDKDFFNYSIFFLQITFYKIELSTAFLKKEIVKKWQKVTIQYVCLVRLSEEDPVRQASNLYSRVE